MQSQSFNLQSQQSKYLKDAGVIQNKIYLNEKQTIQGNKLTIPLINSTN